MRGGKDMGFLSIPLDLRSSSEPVTEAERWLPRVTNIPTMNETVNSASGKDIRMMGREVDISDSTSVAMQDMLDTRSATVHFQIPQERFLI